MPFNPCFVSVTYGKKQFLRVRLRTNSRLKHWSEMVWCIRHNFPPCFLHCCLSPRVFKASIQRERKRGYFDLRVCVYARVLQCSPYFFYVLVAVVEREDGYSFRLVELAKFKQIRKIKWYFLNCTVSESASRKPSMKRAVSWLYSFSRMSIAWMKWGRVQGIRAGKLFTDKSDVWFW